MLKVLGRVTSINVRKVLWTADELGVPYQVEVWGKPHRDPDAPEFRALNPNAQVPVLRDGDFVLWDSSAIVRYLIDKYGPGELVPRDVETRARAEQWFAWQATDLNTAWNPAVPALVRKLPGDYDPDEVAASVRRWTEKMCIFEARLAETQAHAAGQAFSFADISLGLSVHRWFGGDFARPELPQIAAYYERVKSRPAAVVHFAASTP
ncbi:glutathione S-transferase family protein [Terricaulis sp.]|uniref:glutathione S-transferase family protein n=1 Tax=Terricaulis sp. TaxID=2768686 RepID=UPI0037837825